MQMSSVDTENHRDSDNEVNVKPFVKMESHEFNNKDPRKTSNFGAADGIDEIPQSGTTSQIMASKIRSSQMGVDNQMGSTSQIIGAGRMNRQQRNAGDDRSDMTAMTMRQDASKRNIDYQSN